MIYGINPYTISSIRIEKFHRLGPHPSWTKIMCKRNPIRGMLGFYSSALFDGCYLPAVYIYGANGRSLKMITCRSNDHARGVCDDLNQQLSQWVQNNCKCATV